MDLNNTDDILDAEFKEHMSFQARLMNKYPSLFNVDVDGKLLPPDCGIWCPPGWESLVDRLCESIVFRIKNNHIHIPEKMFMLPLRKWIWNKIAHPLRQVIDPTTKEFKTIRILRTDDVKKIEVSHPYRTFITKKIFHGIQNFLVPWNKYKLEPIPEVKIGQIKEKFGTLRFYYDGGDDVIRGMVSFAEALSGNTCEMTGEAGSLCKKGKRGGWYKTLSEHKANEIGYTKVE
jgi:hypothetical protein